MPHPSRLALLLVPLALAASPAAAERALRADGRFFRDAAGAVVILRGLNVAGDSKVPPFRPITGAALFDPLRQWGMNVVRLLFTWEAYEPSPGQFDQGYLDYYVQAARWAGERGLHVVVDFHQDAYSRYALQGCGEGFPAWALPQAVTPAVPDNGPRCANWSSRLLGDPELETIWEAFHRDTHGARTRFLAMVRRVAERLAGESAVIGYDLLNEPDGDEATQLAALHADMATAIRAVDAGAILFVTPHALVSSGSQTLLPRPAFTNFAYSPHYYDAMVIVLGAWGGYDPEAPFNRMDGKAAAWDAPLFLGEFGAPALTDDGTAYVDALYRHLDARFASGAQWVYTPGWTPAAKDGWNTEDLSVVDDQGRTRPNFRVRPYPRRIAGTPRRLSISTRAELRANVLELAWDHDPAAGATEVFLPRRDFFGTGGGTDDISVEATGEGLTCVADARLVTCQATTAGPKVLVVRAAPPPPESRCGASGVEVLLALLALRLRRRPRSLKTRPGPASDRAAGC